MTVSRLPIFLAVAIAAPALAVMQSDPPRDSRGYVVKSNLAQVPAGANESRPVPAGAQFAPNPNQAQVFAPRPSTGDYPTCTREVTDNCIQRHERGRDPN
ncbi:hypothetical protein [Sphingosinicella terrae]|uniref:hypothetical protein n=1 Tax=Sphingosinicella terrae TaxID=2172047 RepID=UPI000E0DFBED|nr:hypothetical protein [Sphingosinicella terrae]